MKIDDLKQAFPGADEAQKARMARTLDGLFETNVRPARPRLRLAVAIALTLLFVASAVAITSFYSIRNEINPKFADKVTDIGDVYENQWLSLSINDALTDGRILFLAMNLHHQPGAEEVFVYPRITAVSQGRALDVDLVYGFDFMDGVWLPEKGENDAGPGNHSAEFFIMEDQVEGAQEEITWTLTFHILKPNWPVLPDADSTYGVAAHRTMGHEAYMKLFEDAYKNKTILLTFGDNISEYSSVFPVFPGFTEEESYLMPIWERLVRSGAFDELGRFSRSITTGVSEQREAEKQTLKLPAFDLEVKEVKLSYLHMLARFDLTIHDKHYMEGWDELEFDAYVNGKRVPPSNRSFYLTDEETRVFRYTSEYKTEDIKELPDEIRFVPLRVQFDPAQPYWNKVLRAEPDEANAFTLPVK